MFIRDSETDRRTDRHDDVKTITPDTSQTWGVKITPSVDKGCLLIEIVISDTCLHLQRTNLVTKNDNEAPDGLASKG